MTPRPIRQRSTGNTDRTARQERRSRGGPSAAAALLAVLAACCLGDVLAAPPFGGEPDGTDREAAAETALAGVHLQALRGGARAADDALEAEQVEIFLPRPPFESWRAVEVTSDDPCLAVGRLFDPGPGYVLVQSATFVDERTGDGADDQTSGVAGEDSGGVTEPGGSQLQGDSCEATLSATFRAADVPANAPAGMSAGEVADEHAGGPAAETADQPAGQSVDELAREQWRADILVRLARPHAPPYPDDSLTATVSFSRIQALHDPAADPTVPAPRVLLLEIAVAYEGTDPLVLHGLADREGLEEAGGGVYALPADLLIGSVAELQALEPWSGEVALQAGESVRLGLVVDPAGRLAFAAGTLTLQPALLVRRGEHDYSFRLNRVSTSWGDELP